jgi:hypothetical protein
MGKRHQGFSYTKENYNIKLTEELVLARIGTSKRFIKLHDSSGVKNSLN